MSSYCECCTSITNLYDLTPEETAITIFNCFAIQIENCNGKQICKICLDKLVEADDFRNLILTTQEVLRSRKEDICNNLADIDIWPKEEYDDDFVTIDDFEPLPIKSEDYTNKITSKNSLVLDVLKKSTSLVIKPVTKPINKLVLKSVTKPQETTARKKLTKAQAMTMCKIPVKLGKGINTLDDAKKQTFPKIKQVIKISKNSLQETLRSRNGKDFIMPKLDEKDFICHECGKQFHNYKSLCMHMNEHYRNFICENCGKGFATKRRLESHMLIHNVKKCICNECGKQFSSNGYLTSHKKRTHARVQPNRCQICGEKFHHYYAKMKHMADVHGQTDKKFKCQHCPREFLISSKLTVHIRDKHIGRERRYSCETCGAAYYDKQTLRDHMTKHTGSRDFKCHLCPKAYPRKFTLREHMRIHNNDKRFKCEICGQAFTQKCTLKGHMKVHQKLNIVKLE